LPGVDQRPKCHRGQQGLAVTRHAGVPKPPCKLITLRIANLLRQRPDVLAFLDAILAPDSEPGLIKLHKERGGLILAWGFTPGTRRKKH